MILFRSLDYMCKQGGGCMVDMARRKLLETSRSFSNALKAYFKTPE